MAKTKASSTRFRWTEGNIKRNRRVEREKEKEIERDFFESASGRFEPTTPV